ASAGVEPKVDTAKSDGYRKKALALYQTILADYPTYGRRDELLFVLAYNQYEIGDKPGALHSYQALIEQFPRSRFVPDAYAQIDAMEDAAIYLDAKAGAHSVDLIDRLAATYFESGKFDRAIRVFRLLQAKAPADPRAAGWQRKILLAYDKLNERGAVAQEMERLVETYGPHSDWAKANAAKGASLTEANELAES